MPTLSKITGSLGKTRMTVKGFKTEQDMHAFQNAQHDNVWCVSKHFLAPGTYVFVGGQWTNVKKLPASVLAHV